MEEIWKETVVGIRMEGKSKTKNRKGQACSRRKQVQSVVAVRPPDGQVHLRNTYFCLEQQNFLAQVWVSLIF